MLGEGWLRGPTGQSLGRNQPITMANDPQAKSDMNVEQLTCRVPLDHNGSDGRLFGNRHTPSVGRARPSRSATLRRAFCLWAAAMLAGVSALGSNSSSASYGVIVAWDPNPELEVQGYQLSVGSCAGVYTNCIDTGKATQVAIFGFPKGSPRTFVAKAYAAGGLQSPPSQELATTTQRLLVVDSTAGVANLGQTSVANGYSTGLNLDIDWAANPSSNAVVYRLYYGLSSGSLTESVELGDATRVTLVGLKAGTDYYFSARAYDANNAESALPTSAAYKTPTSLVAEVPRMSLSGAWPAFPPQLATQNPPMPPLPPPPPTTTSGGIIVAGSGSGTSSSTTSGSGTAVVNQPGDVESALVGMPPRVVMNRSTGRPSLTIVGTVGASYEIQVLSNGLGSMKWTTITNLAITTRLSSVSDEGVPEVLTRAFRPGSLSYEIPEVHAGPGKFYRVVMKDSYPLLADRNLRAAGVPTRLVAVRLPGIDAHVVCYVPQLSVAIDFANDRQVARILPCGADLRQIADKVAGGLSMNWTSASEFTYAQGASSVVATVVKTDGLEDQSVPVRAGNRIKIDF